MPSVPFVVGAGMSPGLSGLLVRHLADQLAASDEIHIAVHGTAGPACARQHHRALGGQRAGAARRRMDPTTRRFGPGALLVPRTRRRLRLLSGRTGVAAAAARPVSRRDANQRTHVGQSPRPPDGAAARCSVRPHPEGGVGALRIEVRGARRHGGRTHARRSASPNSSARRRRRPSVAFLQATARRSAARRAWSCAGDARLDTVSLLRHDRTSRCAAPGVHRRAPTRQIMAIVATWPVRFDPVRPAASTCPGCRRRRSCASRAAASSSYVGINTRTPTLRRSCCCTAGRRRPTCSSSRPTGSWPSTSRSSGSITVATAEGCARSTTFAFDDVADDHVAVARATRASSTPCSSATRWVGRSR